MSNSENPELILYLIFGKDDTHKGLTGYLDEMKIYSQKLTSN